MQLCECVGRKLKMKVLFRRGAGGDLPGASSGDRLLQEEGLEQKPAPLAKSGVLKPVELRNARLRWS